MKNTLERAVVGGEGGSPFCPHLCTQPQACGFDQATSLCWTRILPTKTKGLGLCWQCLYRFSSIKKKFFLIFSKQVKTWNSKHKTD